MLLELMNKLLDSDIAVQVFYRIKGFLPRILDLVRYGYDHCNDEGHADRKQNDFYDDFFQYASPL